MRRIQIAIASFTLFVAQAAAQSTQPSTQRSIEDFWPHVRGTVVDDTTGRPIGEFRITYGNDKSIPYWKTYDARPGKDGQFDYRPRVMPPAAYCVQVRADGYKPAESRVLEFDQREVQLEFRLSKAEQLKATVKCPDGTPAAGADVVVAPPGTSLYVRNGVISGMANAPVKTDVAGDFIAFLECDKCRIIVVHATGSARVDPDTVRASQNIALVPWGTVECVVQIGGQPTPRQTVFTQEDDRSQKDDEAWISFSASAITDETGKCRLERVRGGNVVVAINGPDDLGQRARSWGSRDLHQTPTEVPSGGVVSVKIGGDGQDVVGRFVSSDRAVEWKHAIARFYPDLPGDVAQQDVDWQTRVLQHRAIPVKIEFDGTFRAADVPPGNWRLDAMLFGDPEERLARRMPYIGGVPGKVSIPPSNVGAHRPPIDLGDLPAKFIVTLKDGDPAPDFKFTTLAGQVQALSGLRGKWVVLDFWATWCGPCLRELPELKKSWARVRDDPNVVILGLSLDDDEDKVRAFVDEHGYGWTHAVVGPKSAVAKSYGVTGIPHMVLVDPEGKLSSGISAHQIDKQIQWRKSKKSGATTAPN